MLEEVSEVSCIRKPLNSNPKNLLACCPVLYILRAQKVLCWLYPLDLMISKSNQLMVRARRPLAQFLLPAFSAVDAEHSGSLASEYAAGLQVTHSAEGTWELLPGLSRQFQN